MMTWLLDDARARQEPVAVLWASEAAIYQRFGFGAATLTSAFEVDKSNVVFRDPLPPRDDVRIRMVDIDEMYTLAAPIYDAVRTRVPGTLDRPEGRWRGLVLSDAEWMRRDNGPTYRAVLEVAGEPRGYVIYRVKQGWDARGPKSTLLVAELVALDPDAEQRLWQWVSSMDLVSTITGWRGPVPHPMQLWLQEPRRLGTTIVDGLWLRFVDLPAALAARTYAGEGSLVLEVADALIDSNAGRWQLTVRADGSASVDADHGRARPRARRRDARVRLPGRVALRRPGPRGSGSGVPTGGAARRRAAVHDDAGRRTRTRCSSAGVR